MPPLRIAIPGAAGRMGRLLLSEILSGKDYRLTGAGECPGHQDLGKDAGVLVGHEPCRVLVSDDPATMITNADVIIDFTAPCGASQYAPLAVANHAAYVIGGTALDTDSQTAINQAAGKIPVVQAANMSLGITLLTSLIEYCAACLDDDFDIEVMELHHAAKADAPSGTALALATAAAKGRGIDPEQAMLPPHSGRKGSRPKGGIGFATARGGDAIGDHSLLFCGTGERLELTHRAHNRRIYAIGALKAARWAVRQPPGRYSMQDVLNLSMPKAWAGYQYEK